MSVLVLKLSIFSHARCGKHALHPYGGGSAQQITSSRTRWRCEMDDDETRMAERREAHRGAMEERVHPLWAAAAVRTLGYGGFRPTQAITTGPAHLAEWYRLYDATEQLPTGPGLDISRADGRRDLPDAAGASTGSLTDRVPLVGCRFRVPGAGPLGTASTAASSLLASCAFQRPPPRRPFEPPCRLSLVPDQVPVCVNRCRSHEARGLLLRMAGDSMKRKVR